MLIFKNFDLLHENSSNSVIFAPFTCLPKIQKVMKRSKKWQNGAKSNETETKSDETEQKVAKRTLLYGNMNKK